MPAYVRRTVDALVESSAAELLGSLHAAYADDGFASQYTRQTDAWQEILPKLQRALVDLRRRRTESGRWSVLLEYPLYRLRRRIDIVLLAGPLVVVIECKVGATCFEAADVRQVEEYALDLRDFHAGSYGRHIVPVLWSTEAVTGGDSVCVPRSGVHSGLVAPVRTIGKDGLVDCLARIECSSDMVPLSPQAWDSAAYKPVPTVIEAATSIFAGHDVRSIANADADNLRAAATKLVSLIAEARERQRCYLLMLTGVPGSGKTLAGLHVVHSAIVTGTEEAGDIVYLSGNTPLVAVLRESLARDEYGRRSENDDSRRLEDIRRDVRARIQHISDFLRQSLVGTPDAPPHEHVIVFDEAQRAWDEKQGKEKFDRTASEPELVLGILSRHKDWCACVCLVGGGQEINSGEEGVLGWGKALRRMSPSERARWSVYAPPDVIEGVKSAGSFSLGEIPHDLSVTIEQDLQLRVPQRSYRSPLLSQWVDMVIDGRATEAALVAASLGEYPLVLTRSIDTAKRWLRKTSRGERRYGLLASSGARRLRADGLGLLLDASAGNEIAHWYLNAPGDIRSSFALEVPANEYTCQGLELDFTCICWGGDLLWSPATSCWTHSRLSGTKWQTVRGIDARQHLANSYRVLLTRAREGLVIWVPQGDASDDTRPSDSLDATAEFLQSCGVTPLVE